MRNIKIATRLTICFSVILFMGLLGHLVGVYEVNLLRNQSVLLIMKHQQNLATLQVYRDIFLLKSNLEKGVTTKDLTMLKECKPLLESFDSDMVKAKNALGYSDREKELHRDLINSLTAINDTLPEHIEKIFELAQLGDWLAVELRVKNQIESFVERLDKNVEEIKKEVRKEEVGYIDRAKKAEMRAIWAIIITAIFILLAAGIMAYSVTRSIVLPLNILDKGAKAIAMGDFSHYVEIRGDDELNLMAKTFNQMTGQLAELYSNLEQKVEERTRDLEAKNKELVETQEKLIQSEKLNTISQVIVSLSHEINNPLTVVLGNVMILESEKDTIDRGELGEILITTQQELKRIMNVMKKLRDMEIPTVKTYVGGVEMIDIK